MGFLNVLAVIFAVLAGILLGTFAVIYLIVPFFHAIAWFVKHLARFVWGMLSDSLRCVGALLLSVLYVPMVLGNFIIARFSAAAHYGRALTGELGNAAVCLYRVVVGHPAQLLGLGGLTEGLERRLPAVMAAAPTADLPKSAGKRGTFEGYTIVGSLPGGGSGAKLYVAEPDAVKLASFNRAGISVGQVVIKSFSLADGSSLPQIVRESRSLDAAKRLGLILDHDLTPERFFYVMRYVPGESLSLITKQLHASSPAGGLGDAQLAAALRYAIDLVSTLSAYHRGGLWHKDVKPDNIIVATQSDKRAHLVDFGLVSSLRSAMTLTTHGTEYFRDPEMVRMALKGVKVHEVDGTRFDIYAAGAVLYSMIEDSFPAHGVLSQVERRCPEAVKWVIRRAMTDYDKRYASAELMLTDLSYISEAGDPYAVKPVELPSMSGSGMTAFDRIGGASPIPPLPRDAGPATVDTHRVAPAASPGTRGGIPSIRVTNWWSGAARIDGAPDARAADPATDAVRHAYAAAQQGIAAAQAQLKAAFGGAAPPPVPQPQPGRIVGTPRRPAAEQLRTARERAESRRERARARLAGVRPPTRHFKTGMGGGVGLSLLIFFGGLFGVGALMTYQAARSQRQAQVAEMLEREKAELARAEALRAARAFRSADAVASDAEVIATTRMNGKNSARGSVRKTPDKPAPQAAPIGRSLLLVNDLKTPLSDTNARRIKNLVDRLIDAGVTVLGETGQPGRDMPPEELDAVAGVRFALGTIPLDSSDSIDRLGGWLREQAGEVHAILWISPSVDPSVDTPSLRLFGPGAEEVLTAEQMRRIRDVALRAVNPAV